MTIALRTLVPLRARTIATISTGLSLFCAAGIAGLAALPATDPPAGDSVRQLPVELARSRSGHRSQRKASSPEPADRAAGHGSGGTDGPPSKPPPAQSRDGVQPPSAAGPPLSKSEPPIVESKPTPDVWPDTEVITALKECIRLLGPIAAEVEVPTPLKNGECGAPAPVMLRSLGAASDKIEFRPAVPLNCRMVVALNKWVVGTVQPAAREMLGSPIARISGASYSCRSRNNNPNEGISEHAFANAIDMASFHTADGRSIDVLKNWGPVARDAIAKKSTEPTPSASGDEAHKGGREATKSIVEPGKLSKAERHARKRDELVSTNMKLGARVDPANPTKPPNMTKGANSITPPSPESQFLHKLHKGACTVFATVLGPEANDEHRNHFHVDLQPRTRNAYCH